MLTAQSLGSIHRQGPKILHAEWHWGVGGWGRNGVAGRRDSGAPSSSGSLTARHTLYPYLPLKQAHLSTRVYPGYDVVPHSKPLMSPLTLLLPSEVPALLKRFISTPHPSHTGPNTTAWRRFIPTDNRSSSRPPLRRPCHLPCPCNLHLRSACHTLPGSSSVSTSVSSWANKLSCMTLL